MMKNYIKATLNVLKPFDANRHEVIDSVAIASKRIMIIILRRHSLSLD